MPNQLGVRLRHLRQLTGASAREIARLAGLPAGSHVSLIEGQKAPDPRVSTLARIAGVFEVRLDWLVTGEMPAFRRSRRVDPSADDGRVAAQRLLLAAVARARAANDNATASREVA